MISLRYSVTKVISLSIILFTSILAGEKYACAQIDTTLYTANDSIIYLPLKKYEFGNPDTICSSNKEESYVDSFVAGSTEDSLQMISTPSSDSEGEGYSIMTLADDNTEYSVGQIPYQESVSATGGRIYNVPIITSPLSGFVPHISLQYNSQAGNSIAGYGWQIGGLSSITLSDKNLYYHDKVAPATLSGTSNAYLLDGVPLVQNDDSSSSSQYQLKTARGHILVKKRMSVSAICFFSVLYPDGSKATYGLKSNTTPQLVYPITFWEDRFGNQIEYTYHNTNSEYRIASIKYKHKNHSDYIGQIDFAYTTRIDYHIRYRSGQPIYQNYLLKYISSYSDGSRLCQYTLAHEYKNGVNFLTSIGCTNGANEELRPLIFLYGQDNQYLPVQPDITGMKSLMIDQYFSSDEANFIFTRGKYSENDFGDGLMIVPDFPTYDVVATKKAGLLSSKVYQQYGSMYSPDQVVLLTPGFNHTLNHINDEITVGHGFQCINAIDVDADGTDEIVKINFKGTSSATSTTILQITIYSFDPNSNAIVLENTFNVNVNGIVVDGDLISPAKRRYDFGDFDGDGLPELLTISYNTDHLGNARTSYASLINLNSREEISETTLLSLNEGDHLFCHDIDSDGKTELCYATASGLNIYNLNGTTFTLTKTLTGITSSALSSSKYHLIDINTDGYLDIAREPSGTSSIWYIIQYNGSSTVTKTINLQANTDDNEYMFFDINKDGLPDLIQRSGTTAYVYLNENATYVYSNRITSAKKFKENTEFIHCNVLGYNSMSDFITVEDYNVYRYGFSIDHSVDRLMTKFTNSLGGITVNNYKDISQPNGVYEIDADRNYSTSEGFSKTRFPLKVIYSTQSYLASSQSVSGMLNDKVYIYYDACVHHKGLGFCGFGKIKATDYTSPAEFVKIETYDPEKMGVVTKVELAHRTRENQPYNVTNYIYDSNSTIYGKLNPRLTQSVQTDTLTPIVVTTSYTYDDFDYPKTIAVVRSLGSAMAVEAYNYEYDHKTSTSNYVLGTLISGLKTKVIPQASLFWYEKQSFTYNDLLQPVSCIDYVGTSTSALNKKNEIRWTYDEFGNVLTEKSAPYNVTEYIGNTYTYDANGVNLLSITNALGQVTTYNDYNKYGKPLSVSDHKGRVASYVYDNWGRLVSQTQPDGTVVSFVTNWGGIGCYTVTNSVTGKPAEIVHYDAAGRKIRSGTQRFDSQWIFVDKVYDSSGLIAKESLPFKGAGSTSTASAVLWNEYEYDEYQRPILFQEASGRTTLWEYSGNTITETKNGIRSIKTFNQRGDVWKIQDDGGTITYSLRVDGQPSSVTVSGGQTTSFTYDVYGRRTQISDPSAGIQTDNIVYNSDGSSVSTHTNPNGSILTYIDKYGRTTKVERPGEYTTDYVYNSDGLLISETSSNGTSKSYTYDIYDRILTVMEVVPDGKWLKKTFQYSQGSNVESIAYESQSGAIATETFAYANGNNVRIGLQATNIRLINSENEFGLPKSVVTGGVTRLYDYNAYGMPTRRTMGNVMFQTTTFDLSKGNLKSRGDFIRDFIERFEYDTLNRLVAVDEREITYSDNGNITSIDSVGDMTYDNTAKPYQVTSLTLEDNVVPSRVQNITYTCYSRPSIITEGGRSAAFTYNGDGERVKMNVSDGATSVLSRYYIGNQYELDVTPTGTTERLYLGGDIYSAPMVYIKEGTGSWTLYNIGRDHLGSITHIAKADGTLVEENSYDPWGRLRNPETKEIYSLGTEPELMLGRGYTGHEHLTWFGLINMNARLYDPVLGRFLSPDPFVQMPDFTQNFNRYSYCLNNPLVYVDENGEFVFTLSTFAIIAICTSAAIGVGLGVYEGYKIAERKGLEGSARVWTMIGGGLIGGVAGGASAFVGAYVGAGMVAAGIGGFYAGAITGGAAGATAGFINGFGMGTLETGNPLYGLNQGLYQGTIGGLTGALMGGLIQGTSSAIKGNNFWDGSAPNTKNYSTNFDSYTELSNGNDRYSVYEGRDRFTLETKYVGITKRDPMIRFGEHLNSKTPRALLQYNVIDYGLTKQEARVMEQLFINKYGLENLYNKINSIAPKFWSSYNIY